MAKHKYKQGIYRPINVSKFIGNTATYRSGLELRFFRFCDYNPNILKWASESIVVPYISPLDNKVHRYFVDNFIVVQEGKAIKKYLVEIKPYKQTIPPSTKYRKQEHLLYEQAAWTVNQAKWLSAREYCSKHGFDFIILTEKELIAK